MKTLKNTGKGVVFLFLSSLLIFSYTVAVEAASEIADLQGEIKKIEGNIKFGKGFDEYLRNAKNKLEMIQDANSDIGVLFRIFKSAYTEGKSEAEISKKIAKANSKLEPFFKVDEKGNLQWGAALQMLGIQAQFIPGEFTALRPETAVAVLSEWQQKNRKKMEENKKELKSLKSELKGLQKDETGALTDSQKNARRELDALTAGFNEDLDTISRFGKLKTEYDKAEFEMRLLIAQTQQAENGAREGNELWPFFIKTISKLSELHNEASELIKSLKGQTTLINQTYKAYAKASLSASKTADQVCDYAARASSDPPPSSKKLMLWQKTSARMIAQAVTDKNADIQAKSLKKILKTTASSISRLKLNIKTLGDFRRDRFFGTLQQLEHIKSKLEDAEKFFPRTRELRGILVAGLLLSNDIAPKLSEHIWASGNRAKALAKSISGKDKKLETELALLQVRIKTAYAEVQHIIENNNHINTDGIPKVPELSSDSSALLKKLNHIAAFKIKKLFEKIDSVMADGKEIITKFDTAVKAGDSSTKYAPGELRRAFKCLASFEKKTEKEGDGNEGDNVNINAPEVTDKLKQIIKAAGEAESLWKNGEVKIKLTASADLCEGAGLIEPKMISGLDIIEKGEKEVGKRLRMASALANKCPDIKNPQNINRLYDLAKQLTVNIGAEVILLKKENTTLAEKISLAKKAHADALSEATVLKNTIAEKYRLVTSLFNSLKKEMNALYVQIQTQGGQPDPLWNKVFKAGESIRLLHDQSQSQFDDTKVSPKCHFLPADDIVAKAENTYTGALVSFGADKNLPEEAAVCLAKAAASDDKGSLVVPYVLGDLIPKAYKIIADAGFKPQVELGSETTDPKKINTVEGQSPAKANKGGDVFLKVYTAAAVVCNEPAEKWNSVSNECEAREVTLPGVAGKTYKEAVRLIKQAGLAPLPPALGKPAKDPDMVGKVEFAMPAVDGQLHAGDEVTPYLYGEVEEVGNVPNVIGLGLREAADVVKLAGFNPVIEVGKETADSKKEGTVYDQGPRPGYSLEPGRDVVLKVYIQSIATTPVPRVTGMSKRRARQALKDVGLFVNLNKGKAAPTNSDQGMVYKQYPEPGFEVMDGVGIDIWVYAGAEQHNTHNNGKKEVASEKKGRLNTQPGGVPYIDVPASLFSIHFPGSMTAAINEDILFKGGRYNRPTLGFRSKYDSEGTDYRGFDAFFGKVQTKNNEFDPAVNIVWVWWFWLEPGDSIPVGSKRYNNRSLLLCQPNGKNTRITTKDDFFTTFRIKNKLLTYSSKMSYASVELSISDHLVSSITEEKMKQMAEELLFQIEPYAKRCNQQ